MNIDIPTPIGVPMPIGVPKPIGVGMPIGVGTPIDVPITFTETLGVFVENGDISDGAWPVATGADGAEKSPAKSLPRAAVVVGMASSSRSINDRPCEFDSSAGIGFDATVKSPFLNASYRVMTELIWSLI